MLDPTDLFEAIIESYDGDSLSVQGGRIWIGETSFDAKDVLRRLGEVAERKAIAAEREACAKVAEGFTLAENLIRASMAAERNHVEWNARVCRTIAKAIREQA
jgi:hypothetical protein